MRGSLPPRCVWLTLAVLLLSATVRAEAPPDTEELIAEIDKAFSGERPSLKPPLLIFPVVGSDNRVRADGELSYLAAFAAVYTDRRIIDICVPLTKDVLRDAGCLKSGAKLDEETIRLCLSALEAKLYALPKLVEQGDADVLTIACHGDGKDYRDRTFTHTIAPRDRRRVPGLIAQSVQEYLGVRLSDEQRRRVGEPQLRDEQDLRILLNVLAGRAAVGTKDGDLLGVLERNPRCALAWELALIYHDTRIEALRRFNALQPPLECPRPHLSAAAQIRELGEPARALRLLLPYAASHRGDTYFYTTLMRCAMRLKDERLTRHILERWRKDEPGYSGCVQRGETLTQWAWDARGSGWAGEVTPEGARRFEERLQEAGRELEKAARLNPSGWTAHARLLIVARGLGWPRAVMEDHFHQAVKLRPRYAYAYEMKLEYLKPRWHGEPEDLLEFGRECAETGYWEELIPRLFYLAVQDLSTSPRDAGKVSQVLRHPEVWSAAQEYYRSAQKGADAPMRRRVLNELVRWGIYGQHFDDVVVPCQRLRSRIDRTLWTDRDELEFLYDLVHARTGRLNIQLRSAQRNDLSLAKTAAALAEGDYEQAAKTIEQIDLEHVDIEKVASYRAAIAAGRELARAKQLDLKGAEGLRLFLGCRPDWRYADDRFVCNLPPNSRVALVFPLGIRHGVIRGSVDWSEGISYAQIVAHTRALRDQVILRYLPNNIVQLIRNNVRLKQAIRPAGPLDFRLVYGQREDQLQPLPGIVWQAGVYDDVPSGFSFQIVTGKLPATVTIRGLHVEQTN